MESWKIEHFENEYSRKFPSFRSVNALEAGELRKGLADKLGIILNDPMALTSAIDRLGKPVGKCNADDKSFELLKLMTLLNIKPAGSVYINWYRYDVIDEMGREDLNKYFEDIWYPGPDDIDLFDSTFSWVVSIMHEGHVRCWKAESLL